MTEEIVLLAGLLLELSGVLLVASCSMTKMELGRFPLARTQRQRACAYGIGGAALVGLPIIGLSLRGLLSPWLLWCLTVLTEIACLPALAAYAYHYSWGIGEKRDEDKIQKLHVHGLCILAIGFCLQTLAAVIHSSQEG